ncbi:MAG: DUF2157 domain-containing protein [Armatimonadetes bacterium]|nr:DUF2157 domain-containing protein [Armatimonadota bacterium]
MNEESCMQEDPPPPDWLAGETRQWVQEGLIKAEEARLILARYGLVAGESSRSIKRLQIVHILAALGAVLVGVGVILVMRANWEAIPRAACLALLLSATAACYCAGYTMAFERRNYPTVGMSLLLLGSLLWGASIFLIAQMHHLGQSGGENTGLLYWFIGVLPLAYILRPPLHLVLALAVGSLWVVLPKLDGNLWKVHHLALLFLAIAGLLYAAAILHRSRPDFRSLAQTFGWFALTYLFLGLYILSFRDAWRIEIHHRLYGSSGLWLWLGCTLVPAIAGAAWLLAGKARNDKTADIEALVVIALALLAAGLAGLTAQGETPDAFIAALLAILFNLLLFGAAIGVIWLGWDRSQPGFVNWGLFIFFLQVMARYFDLLGRMLQGGAVFIGAGLLLIFGGVILERQRRRLIGSMERRQPA